ncbi:MAG TPA: translocation/assembly module TamB domain-containing protein, partial [Longimicrobiales bacterium]|nr:translocation/assembly module TamB domain-containing protein [Longimicrobiales bacterium]
TFDLDASGEQVALAGFAFDSARAKLGYTGVRNRGSGSAEVALFQDPLRDYRLQSDFTVALDQKRAALKNLTARFDTTLWTATQPANIGWGKPGVTIAGLDLRSNTGGTLRADGRLPTEGSADLRLDIEKLQLGDITALLQDTSSLQGVFDLHARLQGTTRAPVITGNTTLTDATLRGTALPEVKGTISYANRDLTTHLELFRATTRLAVADAHLPINLALADVNGPRLARTSPVQLDVTADSLPLESLPSFTDVVSDVRGRVRGNLAVRGSVETPTMNGIAQLDLGSLRVNPSGVLYENIVGTVRLRGNTAYVDSIVAHSSGTIRTAGTLDFATLTRPGFDLSVNADEVWLLDNQRGRIRADANLAIKGPYTEVHITGDARVRRGVIYAPEMSNRRVTNLEDPTLRATVDTAGLGLDVLPEPNLLLRNMHVEVMLQVDRDTWARNTQTNVEIFTPEDEKLSIHLDNQHQMLTIDGVLHADRGEYTYAGRNFQLSTGSARFTGGPRIDPLLDLTARYQVQRRGLEALIIDIKVDGSLSQPRVTLQSNAQPPLSQSDLLGYLAFGQSTTSVLNQQSSGAFGVGNGGLVGLPALAEQQLANVAIGASIED